MRPKNGVRSDERRELAQHAATMPVAEHRETPPLRVVQSQSAPAQLRLSMRFSSRGKAITLRCARSSQTRSAVNSMCSGVTAELYNTGRWKQFSDSTRVFGSIKTTRWPLTPSACSKPNGGRVAVSLLDNAPPSTDIADSRHYRPPRDPRGQRVHNSLKSGVTV